MCTFEHIAITARRLSKRPFLQQIERILPLVDALILREKDMEEGEYERLAAQVMKLCEAAGKRCILHSFVGAARRLGCRAIHLPMPLLEQHAGQLADFDTIGASAHSAPEALWAQELGATYVTASHVFPTDCKKDLTPRGIALLHQVCAAVSIPVYALGGITDENEAQIRATPAKGACRMSYYMQW